MKTRYFAFGCSFVNSLWGTLADLIGANFDEYYNFANPGACNTFSFNRFLEADDIYKFDPQTDYITFGITGYTRFSILDYKNQRWFTSGDMLPVNDGHPNQSKLFAKNFESRGWSVYRSWCAVSAVSTICKNKKLKHTIYPSLDNLLFLTDYNLNDKAIKKAQQILDLCDIKESLDEFVFRDYPLGKRGDRVVYFKDGYSDSHPTQYENYMYLKTYFKEFDTLKTKDRFDLLENTLTLESYDQQSINFSNFCKTHRKNINDIVFVRC